MSWGVIFDFDGVVVNSEKQHMRAWQEVAKSHNFPLLQETFLQGFGVKNEHFISKMCKWTDDPALIRVLSEEKEQIYRQMVAKEGATPLFGIRELLEKLKNNGIPCAIGSSAIRKNIDIVLEMTGLTQYFKAICSAEQVQHGKPDPEVYLVASAMINTPLLRTIVIEDAPLGIEAAKRASMHAIAITTTFPRERFQGGQWAADLVIDSFDELSVPVMEALILKESNS
jgi:HAD superfamily hydrolase (TIGR01509 family)